MNTLHRNGDLCIGLLDENNYVIYDESKPIKHKLKDGSTSISYKYKYYYQLDACVKRFARMVADKGAEELGLDQWLVTFRRTVREVMSKITT